MSKYINTDAWWNEAQKLYTNGDCGDQDRYNVGINVGITKSKCVMSHIQGIDIVRCGECKHYNGKYCFNSDVTLPTAPRADDFCSYGERREP